MSTDTGTMEFAGKTAFVTGAGGGMGYQVASDLIAAGCAVTAFDIKVNPGTFPDGPGRLTYIQGDLCDEAETTAAVERASENGLDLVVNAAGIALFDNGDGSIAEIDLAIFDKTMNVNLRGAIYVVRAALPAMLRQGGGVFVHIASMVAIRTMDNIMEAGPLDAYQISKAALASMSRSLAITYGDRNIRSNTVCPGSIDTPMTAEIYKNPARIAAMEQRTPIRKVGTAQDVSNTCLFLLSDKAAFITAADFLVDGGLTAKVC